MLAIIIPLWLMVPILLYIALLLRQIRDEARWEHAGNAGRTMAAHMAHLKAKPTAHQPLPVEDTPTNVLPTVPQK